MISRNSCPRVTSNQALRTVGGKMFKIFSLAALLAFVSATATVAAAQRPASPAEMFGVRESIESIALSPSGNRLAYIAPAQGQGSRLFVVDLASGELRQTTAVDGRTQRLGGCNWVSDERLVCGVFGLTDAPGVVVTVSRLVALDADGGTSVFSGRRTRFIRVLPTCGVGRLSTGFRARRVRFFSAKICPRATRKHQYRAARARLWSGARRYAHRQVAAR